MDKLKKEVWKNISNIKGDGKPDQCWEILAYYFFYIHTLIHFKFLIFQLHILKFGKHLSGALHSQRNFSSNKLPKLSLKVQSSRIVMGKP